MAKWNSKVEALIREAGDVVDKQMKDFVNPQKGVVRSGLRAAFAGKSVHHALEKACKEAGIKYTGNWWAGEQALIALADQNKSAAADKIKAWASASEDIVNQFKPSPLGIIKQIKYAKKKYGGLAK